MVKISLATAGHPLQFALRPAASFQMIPAFRAANGTFTTRPSSMSPRRQRLTPRPASARMVTSPPLARAARKRFVFARGPHVSTFTCPLSIFVGKRHFPTRPSDTHTWRRPGSQLQSTSARYIKLYLRDAERFNSPAERFPAPFVERPWVGLERGCGDRGPPLRGPFSSACVRNSPACWPCCTVLRSKKTQSLAANFRGFTINLLRFFGAKKTGLIAEFRDPASPSAKCIPQTRVRTNFRDRASSAHQIGLLPAVAAPPMLFTILRRRERSTKTIMNPKKEPVNASKKITSDLHAPPEALATFRPLASVEAEWYAGPSGESTKSCGFKNLRGTRQAIARF